MRKSVKLLSVMGPEDKLGERKIILVLQTIPNWVFCTVIIIEGYMKIKK